MLKRKNPYPTPPPSNAQKKFKKTVQNAITKALAREAKMVDTQGTVVNFISTGAPVLISGLAVGTDMFNRIGRQVKWKHVYVRYLVRPTAAGVTGGLAANNLRISLVWDKQPNGAQATAADVYRNVDSAGTAASNVYCFPNEAGTKRFHILRSKIWSTPQLSAAAAGSNATLENQFADSVGSWKVKVGSKTSQFSSTGSGIGNISTGTFFLLFESDIDNNYECLYSTRCEFYDD